MTLLETVEPAGSLDGGADLGRCADTGGEVLQLGLECRVGYSEAVGFLGARPADEGLLHLGGSGLGSPAGARGRVGLLVSLEG